MEIICFSKECLEGQEVLHLCILQILEGDHSSREGGGIQMKMISNSNNINNHSSHFVADY